MKGTCQQVDPHFWCCSDSKLHRVLSDGGSVSAGGNRAAPQATNGLTGNCRLCGGCLAPLIRPATEPITHQSARVGNGKSRSGILWAPPEWQPDAEKITLLRWESPVSLDKRQPTSPHLLLAAFIFSATQKENDLQAAGSAWGFTRRQRRTWC